MIRPLWQFLDPPQLLASSRTQYVFEATIYSTILTFRVKLFFTDGLTIHVCVKPVRHLYSLQFLTDIKHHVMTFYQEETSIAHAWESGILMTTLYYSSECNWRCWSQSDVAIMCISIIDEKNMFYVFYKSLKNMFFYVFLFFLYFLYFLISCFCCR